MEFDLQHTTLEGYRPLLDNILSQEETMESIVPDAYPDVSRIVSVESCAFISAKQVVDGSIRVSGTISAGVLYVPEGESAPKSILLSLPYQCSGDWPQISADTQCQCAVLYADADARMLNPRKLLLKAEVKLRVTAYGHERSEVTVDLTGGENGTIQKRAGEYTECTIAAVTEKPFMLSDTLRPSASRPPVEELLSYRVEQGSMDAKCIGKKLICKGEMTLRVLYRSGKEVLNSEFELPFSQALDIDANAEDSEPESALAMKGVDIQLRDGELDVSLEALIQAILWSKRQVPLLCDTYSTAQPLDVERSVYRLCTLSQPGSQRESGRKFCESGIPAKQVLDCRAWLTPLVSRNTEQGVQLSTDSQISILYLSEDNALCGVSYTMPISCTVERSKGSCGMCACRRLGEITAVPVTGGFEVRMDVEFSWRMTALTDIPYVSSVMLSAVSPKEEVNPSVVVRAVSSGEDLWDIAKSCRSTMEDIRSANDLEGDALADGTVLLIPVHR